MIRNLLLILVLAVSILPTKSQAGLLLEPYLGYSFGVSGDSTIGATNTEYKYNSPTFGARAGYQSLGFMLGLDYSFQSFTLESTRPNLESEDDAKKNQLGIFIGYDLPLLFRFWGTYFLAGSLEGENGSGAGINSSQKFSSPGGYALGVGFTGFPFLSLNLEYRTIKYDKYELNGSTVGDYNEELNLNEIMLSVSLPLNL